MKILTDLHDILVNLFALSAEQINALDREDQLRLGEIIDEKGRLLDELPVALAEAKRQGFDPQSPQRVADPNCAEMLYACAELLRRFQAHEKYVMSQMLQKRNHLGERLTALLIRKSAAAGYRIPANRASTLNTFR